jgi:hypothetical protein
MMTTNAIDLPVWSLRCLHSEWISYTVGLDEVIRDAHVNRAQGILFESWLPSLLAGRYAVTVREDVEQGTMIGLGLPTTNGRARTLFELPARRMGVDLDWIAKSAVLDLDMAIEELLGGES